MGEVTVYSSTLFTFYILCFVKISLHKDTKSYFKCSSSRISLLEMLQHTIWLHGLKESARNHKNQIFFFPIQVLSNSRAKKFQQLSKILSEPSEILWKRVCTFSTSVHCKIYLQKRVLSWSTILGIQMSQVFIYFCSLHCRHGGHPGQDTDHLILSGNPES